MDAECRALFDALQKRKSVEEVKKLITGKTAKAVDVFYGLKPLFWALSYGHPFEVISELLKAYPEAASEKTEEGYTTLHYVEKMDIQSAKLLLEKCPSATAEKDGLGMLPLHWAAENDVSTDIAELLISANKKAAEEEDDQGRLPYGIAKEHDASEGLLKVIAKANPRAAGVSVLPVGLLFPGPGSQYVTMLSQVKEMPIVQAMLAEANTILGFDVLKLCLEGPEDKLVNTLLGQAVVYVADMVALEKLREAKPEVVESCQAVAGLACGEFAALAAAGVFSFGNGLKLALKYAELVQEAMSLLPQGTLSIAGLAEKKIVDICQSASAAAGDGEFCQINNFLFEKGYTIAGTKAALEQCEKLAKKAKAMQVRMLKDHGGFHTTLMQPAKEKYLQTLQEMMPEMSSPRCKVFMNVTGMEITSKTDVATIVELMAAQLTAPVRWKDCVQGMIKDGVNELYECGPGNQLKMMTKRIDAQMFDNTQVVEV